MLELRRRTSTLYLSRTAPVELVARLVPVGELNNVSTTFQEEQRAREGTSEQGQVVTISGDNRADAPTPRPSNHQSHESSVSTITRLSSTAFTVDI